MEASYSIEAKSGGPTGSLQTWHLTKLSFGFRNDVLLRVGTAGIASSIKIS